MKLLTVLIISLALPAISFGQDTADAESADFKKVVQLAVLQPESPEFDGAWSDYVGDYLQSGADVSAAIDKVVDGISEFRRQMRVPGASSGSGAAMKTSILRDKMQALADARLQE
jgi:hypothetical protein